MKKFKLNPKLMLLAMTALSLSPFDGFGQESLFQRGVTDEVHSGHGSTSGLLGRSETSTDGYFTGQGFGATGAELTGQTFGESTPLGSGLFVLLAAGAGYATLKSKKKQQNRKENKA